MRVTVLLVVDDDDLRLFISLVLRRDPRLEVLGLVNSRLEALELIDTVAPDLIILDDGRGGGSPRPVLAPRLRTVSPFTKVLMFTTDDRASTADLPRVDCFVRKDNIVQLLGTVREVLGLDADRRGFG